MSLTEDFPVNPLAKALISGESIFDSTFLERSKDLISLMAPCLPVLGSIGMMGAVSPARMGANLTIAGKLFPNAALVSSRLNTLLSGLPSLERCLLSC